MYLRAIEVNKYIIFMLSLLKVSNLKRCFNYSQRVCTNILGFNFDFISIFL